jgi:ribonuclease P protein component
MDFFREKELPLGKKYFKEEDEKAGRSLYRVDMSKKLTTLCDFQDVFQKGFQKSKGSIVVRFLNNKNKGLRWGVAVSSKKWKKAVERNKIKRLIREVVKPLFSLLEEKNMDIVFVYRGNSLQININDARKDLYDILIKLV